MAFTVTDGQLAVLLRVATDEATVAAPIALAIKFLSLAAKESITRYAPHAPDEIHDGALIRLAGFLYDQDPTDPITTNPMRTSGAEAMLAPWRVIGVGVLTGDDGEPLPVPGGGNVPDPPADGHYILTSNEGVLTWVEFPAP